MKYDFIEEYCLSKKAVTKDFKVEWEAVRLFVGDKMFAMLGEMYGEPIFTLKLEPEYGSYLREKFEDSIIPGYYMNKVHWNTLKLNGDGFPPEMVKEMIDKSYDTCLKSLTKKKQKEIEGM